MTDLPYIRMGGRQRGGARYSRSASTSSPSNPGSPRPLEQRPYRAARVRQSGRGYIESRLNESRPLNQPAHALSMGGYQQTRRVDFASAFPSSDRTLKDEIALIGQSRPQRRHKQATTKEPTGEKPSLMRRYFRHKRLVAVTGVFAVVMLFFGIYVAPVLIAAARAYQDVFVDNSNREAAPSIAIVNANQTPVAASQAGSVPTPTPPAEWTGTEPLTLLLLGVDKRDGDNAEDGSRSDTMILIRIDPVSQSASILSIPRDTKVIVPGFGIQKVNAAYAFGDANTDTVQGGGPGLTMRTIEANFGIHVDYYAEVDFAGFEKIIDTVGGVTIDNPYAIKDDEYPADGNNYMRVYFPPGWQHLDGEQALIYARTRHDDGDAMRSVRQQQILLALREQAMDLDLISNAAGLLSEFGDTVRTDLSPSQLLELARLGSKIDQSNIHQISLMSALNEETGEDGTYYLVPDWNDVAAVLSDFAGETIAPPGSALANPTLNVPIVVRNASGQNGIASSVVASLQAQGFTNVSVDSTATGVTSDYTQIVDLSGNLATSMYLAGVIGVPIDSVLEEGVDDDTIALEPGDWRQTGTISITVGTDVPDPSTYDEANQLEDAFDSYGLDAASAQEQQAAAIAPTSTPPIDYTLPATGNPSANGSDAAGDLSGGPDASLASSELATEPTPTPTGGD